MVTSHTPGQTCDACEGFCLVTLPVNQVKTRSGRLRCVCACCGGQSTSVQADDIDLLYLPRGWSTAPFPVDFAHDDGSVGSTFTCPACNKQLRAGATLRRRAYLGDYSAVLARAAVAKAAGSTA